MADHRESPHFARMGRVYDFIQDHLAEELSIGRLADVAILSPWHFQRVFQEFSGESAAAFVRRIRIERAANLLMMKKNSTVDAVAAECGFGSAELLARHFRKRFRLSPSQWRAATPDMRRSTIRQVFPTNNGLEGISVQDEERYTRYLEEHPPKGTISDLRLERRSQRRVIYARHFQGYDHGISAAWERLRHWASPRGLIDQQTLMIGMGLDNPWITAPNRCRFLCCYSVKEFPEVGDGIGTRTIQDGLFAVVDYDGHQDGLSRVYRELYSVLLPRAQLEALEDVDYLEYRSEQPAPPTGEEYHCRLALRVRSL